jgi:hypothetical protein
MLKLESLQAYLTEARERINVLNKLGVVCSSAQT